MMLPQQKWHHEYQNSHYTQSGSPAVPTDSHSTQYTNPPPPYGEMKEKVWMCQLKKNGSNNHECHLHPRQILLGGKRDGRK